MGRTCKERDAGWLREETRSPRSRVCIPARSKQRRRPATHNRKLYKRRCRIENAFARLKDRRAIAMSITRCDDLFLSAIALAATIVFWLE